MKNDKTVVLAINDVEPGLVVAVKRHGQRLGKELKGIALIDKHYLETKEAVRDTTGLFKEIICDFDNPTEIQTALKPYIDDILVATCRQESSILDFRKVVPFLPYIKTPSESSLLWSTQKQLMRDRLRDYDQALVPQYHYIEEYDKEVLDRILENLEFPVVVKPNGLAASVLVELCHDRKQLESCLEQVFQVIHDIYSRDLGRGKPSVLLEEFMQGEMYSIDAYVDSKGEIYCLPPVRVITSHELGMPGFYGYYYIIPTSLSEEQIAAAHEATRASVKALNLSASTAHVELYLTKNGWKIIELGPRIGGYREALYREACGVDHYYNDLAVRMDAKPELPSQYIGHATGLNIYSEEEGIIESIEGLDEARALPGVVNLDLHAKPGDIALFASNGGKLIIDGIVRNDDPEELKKTLAKVRELIKITVRPSDNYIVT